MKKTTFMFFLLWASCPAESGVLCTGVNDYPAATASHYMTDVLGVDAMDIDESKTQVRFVDSQTITRLMGEHIIDKKIKEPYLGQEIKQRIMLEDIYLDSKVTVVTVKVQFENFAGQKNAFIVSSYTNDVQCSIGKGGLILLNRGF